MTRLCGLTARDAGIRQPERIGMKKFFYFLTRATVVVVTVAVCAALIYLGKTLSYQWWYQDMVQQTVRDMVHDSALK